MVGHVVVPGSRAWPEVPYPRRASAAGAAVGFSFGTGAGVGDLRP
eukprot:CAMPEP_0204275980 /NCGR_PEP_ID=MMETSP0468-20130131/27080_1 /ASSEMBLY_ACC=CAM_ASM_000383 /TAXON_ID=2969 /ORGANISM="Oxyrrhis marina" /LENGTH=44 /DNA_ID= /DNA_START= /DNA_END= /DNA_ORIENTATION=